jgi:hypothetical protein
MKTLAPAAVGLLRRSTTNYFLVGAGKFGVPAFARGHDQRVRWRSDPKGRQCHGGTTRTIFTVLARSTDARVDVGGEIRSPAIGRHEVLF